MHPKFWRIVNLLTGAVFVVAGIWFLAVWLKGGDMSLFENRYTIPWIIPTLALNRISAHYMKQANPA